jgi:hypothetical protein
METYSILVHGCDPRPDDSAQAEEFMAKRMGAEVRKVASSHAAMVSHPKEVADLITLAADTMADATQSTRVSA